MEDGEILIVLIISFLLGLIPTCKVSQYYYTNSAIKDGVGEYYLNEDNNKEFRYIPCKCHKEEESTP